MSKNECQQQQENNLCMKTKLKSLGRHRKDTEKTSIGLDTGDTYKRQVL